MKRLRILATIMVLAVIAYHVVYPSVTVRYRLTLEAAVANKPELGSGVLEVTYRQVPRLWATSDSIIDVEGESVALDLGASGVLFCLLKGNDDYWQGAEGLVPYAFGLGGVPRPTSEGIRQIGRLSGKVDIPLTRLPLLVRFRDLNDPKSIEKVDPLNIAATFGADARLVRVTLEVISSKSWPFSLANLANDRISSGIETRLPWLVGMKTYIDGASYATTRELSNTLTTSDFKRG